jgi:hypothetical protein
VACATTARQTQRQAETKKWCARSGLELGLPDTETNHLVTADQVSPSNHDSFFYLTGPSFFLKTQKRCAHSGLELGLLDPETNHLGTAPFMQDHLLMIHSPI